MDPSNDEVQQNTSENEVDQSVPVTPRRLSDVEVQLPEDSAKNSGSHIWKHFTKDPNYQMNRKASCNYCSKTYTCSASSTTGPAKHLAKYHAAQLNPNQKAQKSVLDMLNESKVFII